MSTQIIIKNSTGSTSPSLQYGELAIKYLSGSEALYAKNSSNQIIAFNDWSKILNKPTTLSGYGITDAVIKDGDVIMNTNPFGGRPLYINSIDNAMFAADKKWYVTVTTHLRTYNSETYPKLNPSWVESYTVTGSGTAFNVSGSPTSIVVYNNDTLCSEVTTPTTQNQYKYVGGVLTFGATVTGTIRVYPGYDVKQYIDSPVVNTLSGANAFDGSYETTIGVSTGYYMKINIKFNESGTAGFSGGYPYGRYFLSYYYTKTSEKAEYRVYNRTYRPHIIGWKKYDFTDFKGTNSSGGYIQTVNDGGNYGRSEIEFIVYGHASHSTALSQIDLKLDRPNISVNGSTFTKYGDNKLYYDIYLGNQTSNNISLYQNGNINASGTITASSFVGNASTATTLTVRGTTSFDSLARLNITNGSSDYGRTQLRITGRLQNGNDGWSMNGRNNIIFAVNANESNVGIGDDGVDKMAIQYNMVTNQLGIVSESSPNSPIASISQNGAATFNGAVAGSRIFTGYDAGQANSFSCSNWFRSNGTTGWINDTYGAGIYSDTANVVRTYSTNKFKVYNTESDSITTLGGIKLWNGIKSVTLTVDESGNLKIDGNVYATGEVSAYGAGSGSTGGGTSYNRLDLWADYSVDKSGWVLSAGLGNDLNTRLTAIEGNGATTIDFTGAGNAITNVTKAGTTLTFTKGLTFLTANQNITLTGDVTGSGNTAITTSISNATVTGKLLTGYVAGGNSALSATDSILSAFGKIQAQINARPGTVTSIGMTLPTGLQVSPSTITSAGTFAVTFTSGYSIPTTTKQNQWDTAHTSVTGATGSNTSNTLVKRDDSGNFSANTITASLTGNASTATKLSSTRTFQLTGDVTGTITSDLSTGATISTTIAANSVALGTDTTGNYAGSISVSGSGLSLSGSAGEGTNYTITSNATSNNVPSTIVYRDSSGDFVAGSIIAEESFNYSTNAYTTYNSITKTIDFVFN